MPAERVGERRVDPRVVLQRRPGLGCLIQRGAEAELRPEAVRTERKARHHAEVAASALERPEQIRMLARRHLEDLAGCGDDLEGLEVVARQAVLARQPPDAAAERESGDAGLGHDAGRDGEPVRSGGGVDVAQQAAALDMHESVLHVDLDAAHAGEVERDPARAQRLPRDSVTPSAHREQGAVLPCGVDDRDHVVGIGAARDQHRALVDHGVPDRPRRVVAGAAGADQLSIERPLELVEQGIPIRNLRRRFAVGAHRSPLSVGRNSI